MEEKPTEETMGEKKIEQPMGERMTEETVGMTTETRAKTLHKLRHTIREILFCLVLYLFIASMTMSSYYNADIKQKNDPRRYLWVSSAVCLVLGSAIWIDSIIACFRYKDKVGNFELHLIWLVAFIASLGSLTYNGYIS